MHSPYTDGKLRPKDQNGWLLIFAYSLFSTFLQKTKNGLENSAPILKFKHE